MYMLDEPYKEIKLNKNKVTKVSIEDYDELIKYNWFTNSNTNHISRYLKCVNGKRYRVLIYRQIMNVLNSKGIEVIHINGDLLDNRRSNLKLKNNLTSGVHQSENGLWIVKLIHNHGSKHIFDIKQKETAITIYQLLLIDNNTHNTISFNLIESILNEIKLIKKSEITEPYKNIYLKNKNCYTKVSIEDYDKFKTYSWHLTNQGYVEYTKRISKTEAKYYKLHRCVLHITDPSISIDHINHDRLDNRRSNLRSCTREENLRNKKSLRNSISSYKGVYLTTSKKHWQASIYANKRRRNIVGINHEIIAALIYDLLAIEEHKNFAYLNFGNCIDEIKKLVN